LLITAVVAKNSTALAAGLKSSALPTLAALFVFFALTHLLGFLTAFHRSRPEKISYAICLSYMNFVTAIYLAEKYFGDPETVLTTVLSIIPWTLLFVFFRTWALSRRRDKIST
jgi:predicted Na+-dependent transporter